MTYCFVESWQCFYHTLSTLGPFFHQRVQLCLRVKTELAQTEKTRLLPTLRIAGVSATRTTRLRLHGGCTALVFVGSSITILTLELGPCPLFDVLYSEPHLDQPLQLFAQEVYLVWHKLRGYWRDFLCK